MVRRKGKLKRIHTAKFRRCVKEVEESPYNGRKVNPYAVCMASIGKEKAFLKGARKKK